MVDRTLPGGVTSAAFELPLLSPSSRLLKPIWASRTRNTSYPAPLISPIASAIRSESESDWLIAVPRSCIKLLRRSSRFGHLSDGHRFLNPKKQLRGQTFAIGRSNRTTASTEPGDGDKESFFSFLTMPGQMAKYGRLGAQYTDRLVTLLDDIAGELAVVSAEVEPIGVILSRFRRSCGGSLRRCRKWSIGHNFRNPDI